MFLTYGDTQQDGQLSAIYHNSEWFTTYYNWQQFFNTWQDIAIPVLLGATGLTVIATFLKKDPHIKPAAFMLCASYGFMAWFQWSSPLETTGYYDTPNYFWYFFPLQMHQACLYASLILSAQATGAFAQNHHGGHSRHQKTAGGQVLGALLYGLINAIIFSCCDVYFWWYFFLDQVIFCLMFVKAFGLLMGGLKGGRWNDEWPGSSKALAKFGAILIAGVYVLMMLWALISFCVSDYGLLWLEQERYWMWQWFFFGFSEAGSMLLALAMILKSCSANHANAEQAIVNHSAQPQQYEQVQYQQMPPQQQYQQYQQPYNGQAYQQQQAYPQQQYTTGYPQV